MRERVNIVWLFMSPVDVPTPECTWTELTGVCGLLIPFKEMKLGGRHVGRFRGSWKEVVGGE